MPRLALNLDTMTQLSFSPFRTTTVSSNSSAASSMESFTFSSPAISSPGSPATTVASPASSPRLRPLSCCYSAVFEDAAGMSPVHRKMGKGVQSALAKATEKTQTQEKTQTPVTVVGRGVAVNAESQAMLNVFEPRPQQHASIADVFSGRM